MHETLQKFRTDERELEELARRYVDLVHAAARRQLGGDESGAEDVTQVVMMILVAKGRAGKLPEERMMAGWLLKVTGYAVLQAKRAAARRARHETASADVAMGRTGADESVRRELDEALMRLPAMDREVVVRRYLRGESLADLGRAVGMTENTAGRRVARALEKLRAILGRRGATAPVAAIVAVMGVEATVKAPAACAAAGATMGTIAALAKGTMIMIAAEKVKVAGIAVALLLLGIGGALVTVEMANGSGGTGQAVAGTPVAAMNGTAAGVTNVAAQDGAPAFDGQVAFSDGTVVGLLGVHGEGAGAPANWWGVDGLPRAEPPHEAQPRIHMNVGTGEKFVRVMMRIPGTSGNRKGIKVEMVPSVRSEASSYNQNGGRMIEAVGVVADTQTIAELRIGMAGGPWVKDVVYEVASGKMGTSATGKAGFSKIEISDEAGEACVTVSGFSIAPELDGDFLAVAAGRTLHPQHGSESKTGITNYYSCAAGDITQVILQTRKFEVVAVKNVSLVPTTKATAVQVVAGQ
jgi:RNA polymerase sigma factor (sigma-70 family)